MGKRRTIEVFRTGRHHGRQYTTADLNALVANFNALRTDLRVPLKLGHGAQDWIAPVMEGAPADAMPAMGWVADLRRDGDRLIATVDGIPDALDELIAKGAYANTSLEMYQAFESTDYAKNLKSSARGLVLSGVALLGAAQPEVKGLRRVADLLHVEPSRLAFSQPPAGAERIAALDEPVRLAEQDATPSPEDAAMQLDQLARTFCEDTGWCVCELHMDTARRRVVARPAGSALFSDTPPPDFSHLAPERVHARQLRTALRTVCSENGIDPACIESDGDPGLARLRQRATRLLMSREEYQHLRPRTVEPPPVEPETRAFTEWPRTPVSFRDVTHPSDYHVDRHRSGGDLIPGPGIRTLQELVLEDRLTVNEAKKTHDALVSTIRAVEEATPYRWATDAPRIAALAIRRRPDLRVVFAENLRTARVA